MDLVFQDSRGVLVDERNIPDALYTANQAQITSWANATGLSYYTTSDNPDPTTGTLTNMTQIQTWIGQVTVEGQGTRTSATATLPSAVNAGAVTAASTASSAASWQTVAAVAILVIGGFAFTWWALESRVVE